VKGSESAQGRYYLNVTAFYFEWFPGNATGLLQLDVGMTLNKFEIRRDMWIVEKDKLDRSHRKNGGQ
jgi:hypothetical protein